MKDNQVAKVLNERNLKVASFAREIGMSQQTLYNVVKKETIDNIGISTILKIAAGLNISAEELYYGTPAEKPVYDDPTQTRLNASYENMNDQGKETLASVARSMEKDTANRILKDSAEYIEYQSAIGA